MPRFLYNNPFVLTLTSMKSAPNVALVTGSAKLGPGVVRLWNVRTDWTVEVPSSS